MQVSSVKTMMPVEGGGGDEWHAMQQLECEGVNAARQCLHESS